MEILYSLFPDLGPIVHTFWLFFSYGGWVLFIILGGFIAYQLYMIEIVGNFKARQEWVFLSIKMPRENLVSTLAVEQIFAQLHATDQGYTMAETYLEGSVQQWYSFEIVSIGGKISFIVRANKKVKDMVEAAFYSQYPEAEITEVEDYLKNVDFHPGQDGFDIFGWEQKLLKSDVYPIKTYKDFEHPTAEVKITDPLGLILEALALLRPDELIGIQIIAQTINDAHWKEKSMKAAQALLGNEEHHHEGWRDLINPVNLIMKFFSLLGGGGGGHGHEEASGKEKNDLLHMTEIEKEQVNQIQRKATKPGFLCKIRILYMAPKESLDLSRRTLMIGAFRTFGDTDRNNIRPDTKETWTKINYRISKTLEAPYLDWWVDHRKHHFWEGYKGRSTYIGMPQFILNTEELATLFHLPLTLTPTTGDVARTDSKKSQAPVNLPVGDY